MSSASSILRHPCLILIIACLWLGGCASKYGTQTTVVNHYPQCYLPIESLRQAEKDFASTVTTTVVVSTLIGALAGLLIGGDTQGVLIGAGVAAAGGLAMGYTNAKQNEHANTNRRMASYMQDLEGDIRNLDEATASARMAIQCYDRQFQATLTSYKASDITRVELDARYREIIEGTQEAEYIMGIIVADTELREEQYTEAVNYEQELDYKESETASKSDLGKSTPEKTATSTKQVKAVAKKQNTQPVKPLEPNLEAMKTQTQNYQNSRQALANEKEIAANFQTSWAADLAALES